MEAAVRSSLGIAEGDVSTYDILALENLNADGLGIFNLSGLHYAVNLRSLSLKNNFISNFSVIRHQNSYSASTGLTLLENLGLSGNMLSEINYLDDFLYLTDTNVDNNHLYTASGSPAGEVIDTLQARTVNTVCQPQYYDYTGFVRARYHFTEGSGSETLDSSPIGNTAQLVNTPAWVQDGNNYALSFDPFSMSYVDCGTASSLSSKTDFTVTAKIRTSKLDWQIIAQQRSKAIDGVTSGWQGEWRLEMTPAGKPKFWIYNGGYQFVIESDVAVADGEWHTVTAVRKGDNGYLYVDGNLVGTGVGTCRDLDGNIPVYIGVDGRHDSTYFEGEIDDVMIVAKAVSPQALDELENNKALYSFNEGSGTVVNDTSILSGQATLVNGAQWLEENGNMALDLENNQGYLDCGTATSLSGKTNFTVSTWIKTSTLNWQIIAQQRSKAISGVTNGWNGEWRFELTNEGKPKFWIYGNWGYQFTIVSPIAVADGQWHHVCAVRDGDNGYLYVDGELSAQGSGTCRDLDGNIPVYIGVDARHDSTYFNGQIDDVAIYSMALSKSTIKSQAGSRGFTPFSDPDFDLDGLENTQDLANDFNPYEEDTDNNTIIDFFELCELAADSYDVPNHTPFEMAAPGVLSNDTLAGASVSAEVEVEPINGTLNYFNSDGSFSYTPNVGFEGSDTFTYNLVVNGYRSQTASVSLNVFVLDSDGDGIPDYKDPDPFNYSFDVATRGDSGTHTITNALMLGYIKDGDLNANYKLGADIDLSTVDSWTPIGDATAKFTGSFDGAGYTVSNLTIDDSTGSYIGLFGYCEGAEIKNCVLENVNITGFTYVGAMAGYAKSSSIDNCSVSGDVDGTSCTGGLVGYMSAQSSVNNCYTTARVSGTSKTGGLIGYLASSIVSNSYTTGYISGSDMDTGGLVGYAYNGSSVSNSYSTSCQ